MRNKKSAATKGKLPREFGDKSPICISLCLCLKEPIEGLAVHLNLRRKAENYGSTAVISVNGEEVAVYDLLDSDPIFWPTMEWLERKTTSLGGCGHKK